MTPATSGTRLAMACAWVLCLGLPSGSALAERPARMAAQSAHSQAAKPLTPAEMDIDARLDRAAVDLTRMLGNDRFRSWVWTETRNSRNAEKILDLESTLQSARGRRDLGLGPGNANALLEDVRRIQQRLRQTYGREIRLDLYLPVDAHRATWRGGTELVVAAVPVGDERGYAFIKGYATKDLARRSLNPNEPPSAPLLVIAPCEHRGDHAPVRPLPTLPPGQAVHTPSAHPTAQNGYLGVQQIRIWTKSEGCCRGDPEIYLLIGYEDQLSGQEMEFRCDLKGVDDPGKWYLLGLEMRGDDTPAPFHDHCSMRVMAALRNQFTQFRVMEEDGGNLLEIGTAISMIGWPALPLLFTLLNQDDDLGRVDVHHPDIPWTGYTLRSTSPGGWASLELPIPLPLERWVDLRIDKDPPAPGGQ